VANVAKYRVQLLCISKEGSLVAYSSDGNIMCAYCVNGKLLRAIKTGERIHCLILSEDHKVVLSGGDRCLVVMRWVHDLTLANSGPRTGLDVVLDGLIEESNLRITSPIRSLCLTKDERHLIVGLECGAIRILFPDPEYLRARLATRLQDVGILNEVGGGIDSLI